MAKRVKMRRVGVRTLALPSDITMKLDFLADQERSTPTEIVKAVLRQYLEEKELNQNKKRKSSIK